MSSTPQMSAAAQGQTPAEGEGEQPAPMHPLQAALTERGALRSWDETRGELSATVARESLHETVRWLKEAQGFARLSGVVGIDTLKYPVAMPGQEGRGTPRFGVLYHLAALPPGRERLRVRTFLPEGDPTVQSVVDLWAGADFFEREIYDLFGIVFAGHPDLRRIVLAEDWTGHPLRKDYPVGGERVEFTHTVKAITRRRPSPKS